MRADLAIAALLISCNVEEPPDAGMEESMVGALKLYKTFTKINETPFSSSAGAFDVNVLVNQASASYAKIHPDTSNSRVVLPVGTVIVREVLDGANTITQLTVMAKGPPGADLTLGDWWFAVTDRHGVPQLVDGVPQIGPMPACQACHLPRSGDDYLFGVASTDE